MGWSRVALTHVNTVLFAPMPSARVRRAMTTKPGDFRRMRSVKRNSRRSAMRESSRAAGRARPRDYTHFDLEWLTGKEIDGAPRWRCGEPGWPGKRVRQLSPAAGRPECSAARRGCLLLPYFRPARSLGVRDSFPCGCRKAAAPSLPSLSRRSGGGAGANEPAHGGNRFVEAAEFSCRVRSRVAQVFQHLCQVSHRYLFFLTLDLS